MSKSKTAGAGPLDSFSRGMPTRRQATKIALGYLGLGALWIFCTDWAVYRFVPDPELAGWLDTFKGWLFVLITSLLLGWVLDRHFRAIRRAAQRLADEETRQRVIGDNLPDSFVYQYTVGPDGRARFTHISAGVERVNGVPPAAVLQDSGCLMSQIDPEQLPGYAAAETESAQKLTDFGMELRMRRPGGEVRLVQVRSRPSRNAEGRVQWDGLATDITERVRAEKALRESERLLQTVINLVPHAIFAKDRNSRYLLLNEACVAMNGLAPGQMLGRTDLDFIPDRAQAEAFLRDDREVIASGRRKFVPEEPFTNKAGQTRILQTVKVPFESPGTGPSLLAVAVDITERKAAELALRASEEQFRTMFELASIGMVEADPQTGRFERVNRKLCEITGYSADELLQMKVPELTPADDRARGWEEFRQVLRSGAPSYQGEMCFARKDGNRFWVNITTTILRDAAGRPVRTMATVEDITARRLAEEERMRLSTALEQAAESIVITDLKGTILYANPAFERITGYSPREAVGQNPRILNSGRHDADFFKAMWATLARGEVWHGHFINKRKDGTLYEEEATISPVRDAAGKIVSYMAIKLDVTREVQLEGQFRQSQKLEAIGQLAGGVAHDFNNILTSILIQIELANMEPGLPPDVLHGLQQIHNDAGRAASLTRQLLLFSRRQIMQSRDLDLNETVTNLSKMLRRIIGEDVHLELDLHRQPLLAHADAGMLDQVVMNLAVNARDAMPEGGRLLIGTSPRTVDEEAARRQPDAAPGHYVCLSVTDTGGGIPAEVMPHIFEPFFTTKGTGKGTGLGLATVFGIVKQHHGWVTVASEPGQGTTFEVFLPAISRAAVVVEVETRPRAVGGTETILLAEDDAAVRKATITILRHRGYRVLEAATGPEARHVWEANRDTVALLLTDLVMPGGVSGRELAQQLQIEKPDLKVIFASGYSAEIAGKEIQLRAGENFLQKPFGPGELLKIIRSCLDV